MSKLIDCKRGILFSLGLMLLSSVILLLAVLIFHNAQKAEEIIGKLIVLDRVYDLDNSIQKSVSDIFMIKSGISINITNNSVFFEEILPNDNLELLNSSMFGFKNFVENNISNINLTITNVEELPLIVIPQRITYAHKDNWSNVEVVPESMNFNGYSLIIDTDKNVSCVWDVNSGSLNFSLEVRGDVINCDFTSEMIDPSVENEIRIDSIEEGNIMIIKTFDNGKLSINLTRDISIAARTGLLISQPQIDVLASSIVLGLDFKGFGIYEEKKVKII